MVLYNIIGWLFQFQILVNLDVLAFVEEIHCKALCYRHDIDYPQWYIVSQWTSTNEESDSVSIEVNSMGTYSNHCIDHMKASY